MLESFKKFFFSRWLSYIADKPFITLLGILIITALVGANIPWLTFSTSVRNLIVDDIPERLRYEEFKALFGSDEIIHVVIKGDDVFSSSFFSQIRNLSMTFGQFPGVDRVISLSQVKNSVDPKNDWTLERFSKIVAPVKIFQRYLVSQDHRVAGITLILNKQADQEAINRFVNASLTDFATGYQSYQVGLPSVSIALSRYTQRDFFYLPFYTNLIIAVFLLLFFRSFVEMAIMRLV